jgi:hypothetical protein
LVFFGQSVDKLVQSLDSKYEATVEYLRRRDSAGVAKLVKFGWAYADVGGGLDSGESSTLHRAYRREASLGLGRRAGHD